MEELKKQFSDKALKDFKLIDHAVNEGDEQAYAELMERYKRPVYHMVLKIVRNIDDAEDRLAFESYHSLSPDEAFDRRCLMSIFEEIFAEIESSYSRRNELEVYHAIAPYFAWGRQDEPHASVAEELGMTAGALRMRISRVRSMVETRLRKYIRQTVNSDAEVDEEIDHYRRIASKY